MDNFIMVIRVLVPLLMVVFLLWMIFNARNLRFQPIRATKLKVGVVGFITGYISFWALLGDGFIEHIPGKVFIGLMSAGLFSLRLVSIMEGGMRRGYKND